MKTKVKCRECGRVFDLTDETDAEEWHYGHDCEAESFIRSHIIVMSVPVPPAPVKDES